MSDLRKQVEEAAQKARAYSKRPLTVQVLGDRLFIGSTHHDRTTSLYDIWFSHEYSKHMTDEANQRVLAQANLIVALVNAYHNGDLVWREEASALDELTAQSDTDRQSDAYRDEMARLTDTSPAPTDEAAKVLADLTVREDVRELCSLADGTHPQNAENAIMLADRILATLQAAHARLQERERICTTCTSLALAQEYEAALDGQGLPHGIPLERFVQHHRGNAAFAAALESAGRIEELEAAHARSEAVVEAAKRWDAFHDDLRLVEHASRNNGFIGKPDVVRAMERLGVAEDDLHNEVAALSALDTGKE